MPVTRQVDNVIAEGLVEHGIYPTCHEEIGCSVILRGDYKVLGGVYGARLKAMGSGVVHGPVVTREDLLLDERELTGTAHHSFLSGLTAPTVLRNEVPAYTIAETVVRDLANAKLRVRGPILADTVHLSNALIIGNIHARQVTLEACVVFGTIECEDLLVMNTCNFVAYRAGRARLMGRMSTWLGYGVSYDGAEFMGASEPRPHIENGHDSFNTVVPPDLRYLPVCMSGTACDQTDDFETCDLYHGGRVRADGSKLVCPSCRSCGALVPRASLLDLDFQIHIVRRPNRDPEVDFRESGGQAKRAGLSEVLAQVSRGVDAKRIEIRVGRETWQPLEEHPLYEDHDPEFEVQYERDGRRREASIRIGSLSKVIAECQEPGKILIRRADGDRDWRVFHEHPGFRERFLVSRALNVAGRLLDSQAIRASLTGIKDLAHTIAHYPYLDAPSRARVLDELIPKLPKSTQALFGMGVVEANVRQMSVAGD